MKQKMQQILVSLLEQGVAGGCFPGAAAAVGRGHELWAMGCAGALCLDGPPVNAETRYDMASLTKVLAPTMIALRLLEEGKLSLYDTISQFFPDAPQDKREITVFQLMTHTAGFNPSFLLENECSSADQALQALFDHPLDAAPGGAPSYSCMGYITLGKMLETLCGRKLDALAREMVFSPLGMHATGYCPAGGNIAATEVDAATGRAWTGVVHDENARFLGGVSGNAGVFSNILDMTRFAQMLSCEGDGFVTKATLRKAIENQTPGADVHRGLGFHLGGTACHYLGELMPACSFGHTGFTGTSLGVDPTTGYYVVLLTNRVHPTRDNLTQLRFRRLFHNALYAAFCRERADN